MKWITRKNIKVDRVACPWLINRFIDPDAEFLFVEEARLLEVAAREGAIPFDAPRLPVVKLNHRGDRCTFEAIMEDYKLDENGLSLLALIVRAADIKGLSYHLKSGQWLSLQNRPMERRSWTRCSTPSFEIKQAGFAFSDFIVSS